MRKKNSKRISLGKDLTKPTSKILIIGTLILILFAVVSVKALDLQVLSRERAVNLAKKQHQKSYTLLPKRGMIYDINKKELAINIDTQSIYVNAKDIKDPEVFSKKLSEYLKLSQEAILDKINTRKPFVWIKRLVEPNIIAKIKSDNFPDLGFIEEPKRVYPNGTLVGQVLGFTNIDSKGIEGIEFKYDELLTGKPGKINVKKDARGRKIMSTPYFLEPSISGYDLVLTIDSQIQHIVEKELKEGVEKAKADRGMALLMNSETGAILAMASYPFFDPNSYKDSNSETRRNLPIWFSFEPGSTMKVFILASAMEEDKVNPDTKFDCENGRRKVGPAIIRDVHPYGVLTVAQILEKSSNICASKIGETLGREKLYDRLSSFGFGRQTGIDLSGESSGMMTKSNRWGPVELATISFGQGIAVTSIQIAAALSAIANGGYLVKPYIVEQLISPGGKVVTKNKPEVLGKVISYDTAENITQMMEKVVESGTGKNAAISGYKVAGKTGTAQVPNPKTGGYYGNRFMSSFIGFGPTDDPKVTLVVIVENPKNGSYGGTVAAPIFKGIVEKVLFYLRVPPRTEFVGTKVMPDLQGKSLREILIWSENEGVEVRIKGTGYVTSQEPKAGEAIKEGTVCRVDFKQSI
ncbi:MAG TPA: penicillin-binding transpeptidase domain-containing protein [Thermodesulfobacteriota bacterium]